MKKYFPLVLAVIWIVSGCVDNDIEGLNKTTSVPLKATKVTSSYDPNYINQCSWTSSSGTVYYGTEFKFEIEYEGQEKIQRVQFTYKTSSGSTYSTTQDWTKFYNGGSSTSTFRGGAVSSVSPVVLDGGWCWTFGSSTNISFNFTLTDFANKNTTISYILIKPAGAN